MTARYLYTVTEADINKATIEDRYGKIHVTSGVFGNFQPQDVGKRIYLVNNVIQMENNEQRDKRLSKEEI